MGITVLLSTVILGIHWMADIMAGLAMGVLSFSFAIILDQRIAGKTRRTAQPAMAKGRPTFFRKIKLLTISLFSKPKSPDKSVIAWKSIFLSYRREKGSKMARIVQSEIEKRGYSVFLDVDDLGPNQFDEKLLTQIEMAPNFVLILAPGSLDRCDEKDDWLFKEIAHAIKIKSNIVPVMTDSFQYPPQKNLPSEIKELVRHNSVIYSHDYFEATFNKLEGFLKKIRTR